MTRIIIAALVVLTVSSPAVGKTYAHHLPTKCSDFTELYARSGLTWTGKNGQFANWKDSQFGYRIIFIFGYLTYAGKNVLPSGHHINKARSGQSAIAWIGSWCRDHPSKDLTKAIDAFIAK